MNDFLQGCCLPGCVVWGWKLETRRFGARGDVARANACCTAEPPMDWPWGSGYEMLRERVTKLTYTILLFHHLNYCTFISLVCCLISNVQQYDLLIYHPPAFPQLPWQSRRRRRTQSVGRRRRRTRRCLGKPLHPNPGICQCRVGCS